MLKRRLIACDLRRGRILRARRPCKFYRQTLVWRPPMRAPAWGGRLANRHLSADLVVMAAVTRARANPVAGCASAEASENTDALGFLAGWHVRVCGRVFGENSGGHGARIGRGIRRPFRGVPWLCSCTHCSIGPARRCTADRQGHQRAAHQYAQTSHTVDIRRLIGERTERLGVAPRLPFENAGAIAAHTATPCSCRIGVALLTASLLIAADRPRCSRVQALCRSRRLCRAQPHS
jgi:hypothetical protein